jgi:hypothetical protein
MAWEPRIEAQFVRPLVRNLRRIIERDAPEALAWAASPETVAPFKWFGTAWHTEPRYPFVLVLADSIETAENAEGSAIDETHTISLQIGACASDPDKLADELFIRVNAVDSIIRESSWEDVLQGIATTSYGPPVLELSRHDFGQLPRRNANQLYMQVAAITIKISYFETKLGVL